MTTSIFAAAIPVISLGLAQSSGMTAESLQDLILRGGPLMIPIALCSLVALAFSIERWIGLRTGNLGSNKLGRQIVEVAEQSGSQAALRLCNEHGSKPLARVVGAALERPGTDFAEREKVVEDAAYAEVRKMSRNLRPLFLVWLIAPLLGLLGTVWGMIEAFGSIAGEGGIGKPELLAGGIYRALTTTAAGLVVAIPAICAYWFLQGRIENFAARAETVHRDAERALRRRSGPESGNEVAAAA
ncbi:MAG: MotA/TolQ/ExbB proton channel family protein, partial [Planctomycetota bacterium]